DELAARLLDPRPLLVHRPPLLEHAPGAGAARLGPPPGVPLVLLPQFPHPPLRPGEEPPDAAPSVPFGHLLPPEVERQGEQGPCRPRARKRGGGARPCAVRWSAVERTCARRTAARRAAARGPDRARVERGAGRRTSGAPACPPGGGACASCAAGGYRLRKH